MLPGGLSLVRPPGAAGQPEGEGRQRGRPGTVFGAPSRRREVAVALENVDPFRRDGLLDAGSFGSIPCSYASPLPGSEGRETSRSVRTLMG
jgi:hypothetical protein